MSATVFVRDETLLQDPAGDFSVTGRESAKSSGASLEPDVSASVSIDVRASDLLAELRDAAREAAEPGWDGYGGTPVSDKTLDQARRFLAVLPVAFPAPEVSVHPDGEVGLYWTTGARRNLTVSVSSIGRISYAMLNGFRTLHGSDDLLGGLPRPILFALRELFASTTDSGL